MHDMYGYRYVAYADVGIEKKPPPEKPAGARGYIKTMTANPSGVLMTITITIRMVKRLQSSGLYFG
jgi:hypothetical protein